MKHKLSLHLHVNTRTCWHTSLYCTHLSQCKICTRRKDVQWGYW